MLLASDKNGDRKIDDGKSAAIFIASVIACVSLEHDRKTFSELNTQTRCPYKALLNRNVAILHQLRS